MKAVLVIDDMPKNCDECPLERWGIDGWNCTPMNQVIEDDKPEWCPLNPLPTEMKVVAVGWNASLKVNYVTDEEIEK